MSDPAFEYDDGGGFDAVAVDEEPIGSEDEPFVVSQQEWEAAQAQLAQAAELVEAVQSQSQQDKAAQLYARRDQWLGDPLDDPAGYAERVQQMAQATADARVAPLEQWYQEQAQERALSEGGAEADQLIAGHAERLGVELDTEAAKEVISAALEEAFRIRVAAGDSPEEATAYIYTPERGREAIRLYAEKVAHAQAVRGGDEVSLVAKHLGGPRGGSIRPAGAQYRDEQHRAVAEQALRGQ